MMSKFKYKNTTIALAILFLTLILGQLPLVRSAITSFGEWGYLGAFLAGIFFVSIFTVAPATLALYLLASYLNPIEISLLAGAGAIFGDLVIFKVFKDGVFKEIAPLFDKFPKRSFFKRDGTVRNLILFVLGSFIIMSPIPDEVGIGLLGLSRIKIWQFALLSFALNSIGIYLIVSAIMVLS
ncbi:MAG: hypothetical protein PHN44_02025 [Candidatus Marinimicrobia bacterium]|nr:hypothetical protein [Candidatus Neomarinimicrobiota bacterium]